MQPNELTIGGIYFGLAYEDEEMTRFIIHSYEYLGHNSEDLGNRDDYLFRFIGSEDELILTERNLDLILNLSDLIEELKKEEGSGKARAS